LDFSPAGRSSAKAGRAALRRASRRILPPPSDPEGLQRSADDIHDELGIDSVVIGPEGTVLASAGNPIPIPDEATLARIPFGASWIARGIVGAPARGGSVVLLRYPLAEGAVRRAAIRAALLLLGTLAVSLALVYPLSRSITRPLEQLTSVVEAYGRGDLSDAAAWETSTTRWGASPASFDEMADRIQAARKAEKELLANVSHELRTPLARIKVALELIDAQDETVRRRLLTIEEEVDELDRLVADVLTASRLDLASLPLRKVPVDVQTLVEKARQRVLALDPSLRVDAQVEPRLTVEADEALLSRALDNLLDNARKYGVAARSSSRPIARTEKSSSPFRDRAPHCEEDPPGSSIPSSAAKAPPPRPRFRPRASPSPAASPKPTAAPPEPQTTKTAAPESKLRLPPKTL